MEARVITGPAKNILRFAADRRDEVDLRIVTFERSPASPERSRNLFIDAARELAIPVEIVPETGRFDFRTVRRLSRLFSEQQPDIVQTHGIKSHFLVSLVSQKPFRWIGFHHGYTSEDLKMRLYGQFDRLSLRRCHRVITVCEPFARMLKGRGVRAEHISVVPNSVRTELFVNNGEPVQAARQRFGLSAGEKVILTVGRLSPEKGHRYLIEAMHSALRSPGFPPCRLLIAGDGLLRPELTRQIEALGLNRTVMLVGHHPDVQPLFAIADLFVLPSLSEGSPNVLLEAMAARLPIVASRVGGVPETAVDGESALLVPAADPWALSQAIARLLTDAQLAMRLADAAYARARDCFSPANYDRRILSVYQTLLNS